MYVGSRLKRAWKSGRRHLKSLPSSRTGENPPYGMIGGSRKRRHHSKPVRASILPDHDQAAHPPRSVVVIVAGVLSSKNCAALAAINLAYAAFASTTAGSRLSSR